MSEPTPPTASLWQIYKSRFLYTQSFIVIACMVIYFYRRNLPLALLTLGFLQLAAVYGSWMGKRMLDRMDVSIRPSDDPKRDRM